VRCLSALGALLDEDAIKEVLERVLKDGANKELLAFWKSLADNGRAPILAEFFKLHAGVRPFLDCLLSATTDTNYSLTIVAASRISILS
jgi:hypothetical protein